jgi:hypothetical protein
MIEYKTKANFWEAVKHKTIIQTYNKKHLKKIADNNPGIKVMAEEIIAGVGSTLPF